VTKTPSPPAKAREAALRSRVKQLASEVREWEEAHLSNVDALKDAIGSIQRLPEPRLYVPPKRDNESPEAVAVLRIGDWHTGLVVDPQEVQDYNAYNWKIAERRRKEMLGKFVKWVERQRTSYAIRGCVVVDSGDMLDGTIHHEQYMYNEFSPPTQAIRAGHALSQLIVSLAEHFEWLRVESLSTDNHGRLFKKPMYTGRGEWTWNTVYHEIARVRLENCKNVELNLSREIKREFKIYDTTFMVEHGNDIKAWMGIPHYGLERLRSREALRRSATKRVGLDYLMIGHFHTYAVMEGLMINGALCGTTPYDHAVARYAPPSQSAFLVGKHGVYNFFKMDLS
jgi:hypothetical protein